MVKGPPATQLGGEMPYFGNKWVFTPLLSAWGPFYPPKSVPEVDNPLSFDNRGMKIISVLIYFEVDFLVIQGDFSHPTGVLWGV